MCRLERFLVLKCVLLRLVVVKTCIPVGFFEALPRSWSGYTCFPIFTTRVDKKQSRAQLVFQIGKKRVCDLFPCFTLNFFRTGRASETLKKLHAFLASRFTGQPLSPKGCVSMCFYLRDGNIHWNVRGLQKGPTLNLHKGAMAMESSSLV